MRVEAGRVPDVETFGKLCVWLGVDPKIYLGIESASPDQIKRSETASAGHVLVSAHFKADRVPNQETVRALASMIMFAVEARRQHSTITDADT
jgi:hypothetical protein